jgi:hypothetical protein
MVNVMLLHSWFNARLAGLSGLAEWLGRLLSSAFVDCPLVPAWSNSYIHFWYLNQL